MSKINFLSQKLFSSASVSPVSQCQSRQSVPVSSVKRVFCQPFPVLQMVRCNHFESLSRSRSLKTLFVRMCAQNVVTSCLILFSSRTIHNRRIRFLLTLWRTWLFESQMTRFACWKWFNKSEMKLKKWLENIMNHATWLMNFKTKKKFYKRELLLLKTTRSTINILFVFWKKNWKFLRRFRIVLVMCENSLRHRSDDILQIKKWLQTLMRQIDSKRQSDQLSFQIRQSLSKTKQSSSIDYRLCRTNWKRTSIDTQLSEWRWHM
jgi:hypothetical protein